VHMFTPLP